VVMELFAGVTGGAGAVPTRRSSAWKQVGPMALSDKKASTSGQPAAAGRGSADTTHGSKIAKISVLLFFIEFLHSSRSEDGIAS
jgi:hypothetical protein